MGQEIPSMALGADSASALHGKIPKEHQEFIDLSKSNRGMHKRAEELIMEYHRPYPNLNLVIDQLRAIALDDFWFYDSLDESKKAFTVITDTFNSLIQKKMDDASKEKLVQTLFEFIDVMSQQKNPHMDILDNYIAIIEKNFSDDKPFFISNSGYFKSHLNNLAEMDEFSTRIFEMTKTVLNECIRFWESTSDAEDWLQSKRSLFQNDYGEAIGLIGKPFFSKLKKRVIRATDWEDLAAIPSYKDIANHFRKLEDQFDTPLEKIYFIFYLIRLPGMEHLRNHLIWDMNRSLRIVRGKLEEEQFVDFLGNVIDLFEELKPEYAGAVLDCTLTLGKEVLATKNQKIIDFYIDKLINFGFVNPGEVCITQDWQIRINRDHIKNLRVWLELIECDPPRMERLLSALITNLRVGGIFISDTDLFQKDVTKLLNSNIAPIYGHVKQLARMFPVYFNEIGAGGELREMTTALDELSCRRDKLVYFLRKQVHAESNNTNVELAREIIQFWYDGKLDVLKKIVPDDVISSIDLEGEWFVPVHEMMVGLCESEDRRPEQLSELDEDELERSLSQLSRNERDEKRLRYLFRLYNLLRDKYSLEAGNIADILKNKKYRFFNEKDLKKLHSSLRINDAEATLKLIYQFMDHLKAIILDPEPSEGWEDIYYKRHIAAGIPSMYGAYHEPKFEALGLTFRLEKTASRLMGEIISQINLDYITEKKLRRIYDVLSLFEKGLNLEGIYSRGFNSSLKMFQYSFASPSFSLDQYVNIFQFMADDVKDIINEHFLGVYDKPLKTIIPQTLKEGASNEVELRQIVDKKSEEFYREMLASTFLIQILDNFISVILNSLRNMADNYASGVSSNIMSYDQDLIVSPLYKATTEMDNPLFLGTKAYLLKKLYSFGFPVPPGFVLTTELFRHKEAILNNPRIVKEIDQILRDNVSKLEELTGKQFGNPENPLLLSVRSGTAMSMPGAMNTFLNVGLNDKIAKDLSKQPDFGWTVWDCYRRFLQNWGMAYGIDRDIFDRIMLAFKSKYKVEQKIGFTPEQMKNIASAYKGVLLEHGIRFEEDPFLQLRHAVFSVADSWDSDRAKVYRENLQIASEWGTAVIVQKMVFGNISKNSGSGVVFTHDPYRKGPGVNPYGDFTICSQGEDIVSGLVHTLPITEYQRRAEDSQDGVSLQSALPRIYQGLSDLATQLIDKYGFGDQEIEFTFESDDPDDLYILQIRPQDIQKRDKIPAFTLSRNQMNLVGRGIGIGGGALNGILAFNMRDLGELSKKHPDAKHILVRPDTVPDDVGMIFKCDGLLTARGGATSHAAVTAARLGKVCVVNCRHLVVNEAEKRCDIGGVEFRSGDKIAIDGRLGDIYKGNYPTRYIEFR